MTIYFKCADQNIEVWDSGLSPRHTLQVPRVGESIIVANKRYTIDNVVWTGKYSVTVYVCGPL